MTKLFATPLSLVALAIGLSVNTFAQTCPGSPGCIDPTFGIGGMAVTSPPLDVLVSSGGIARDMVIQADGKIVMLASSKDAANTMSAVLIRLTANGSIDAAFGNGGQATVSWGTPNYCLPTNLAIQVVNGEERFVVSGTGNCAAGNTMRIERYTKWGALDTTFGVSGAASVNISGINLAMAIQSDQKIVLTSGNGGYSPLVRLKANGTPDTSFGPNGISTTSAGIGIRKLKVLPNGKFLGAGYCSNGTNNDFVVWRFNSNGKLDTSFGSGGWTMVDFAGLNDYAYGFAVDAAGKILVSGVASYPNSLSNGVLIRLKSNGGLDTTFGIGGKTAPLPDDPLTESFTSVSVQANGKIMLAGSASTPSTSYMSDILTARYNSNGTLDTTYSSTGWNITDIYGADDAAAIGLIQYDSGCSCEKFVIGGRAYTQPIAYSPRFIVNLRYTF